MARRKKLAIAGMVFAVWTVAIILSGLIILGFFENTFWTTLGVIACVCASWFIARWAKRQTDLDP